MFSGKNEGKEGPGVDVCRLLKDKVGQELWRGRRPANII